MMKKKNLKVLKLNKKSISNFSVFGGAPAPVESKYVCPLETALECEPSLPPETFARMCMTTIVTTACPSAFCY